MNKPSEIPVPIPEDIAAAISSLSEREAETISRLWFVWQQVDIDLVRSGRVSELTPSTIAMLRELLIEEPS